MVNISRQVNSVAGGDLAKEGELLNAAVIHLYISQAVKSFLVSISKHAKWVEEAKRRLGAKLGLEGIQGRGGLANLGGGKGGGGTGEEGSDGELHLDLAGFFENEKD